RFRRSASTFLRDSGTWHRPPSMISRKLLLAIPAWINSRPLLPLGKPRLLAPLKLPALPPRKRPGLKLPELQQPKMLELKLPELQLRASPPKRLLQQRQQPRPKLRPRRRLQGPQKHKPQQQRLRKQPRRQAVLRSSLSTCRRSCLPSPKPNLLNPRLLVRRRRRKTFSAIW